MVWGYLIYGSIRVKGKEGFVVGIFLMCPT